MTRQQIETIAREHKVDEAYIRGATKAELVKNVLRWWSGLASFEIIATVAGSKTAKVQEYQDKQKELENALGHTSEHVESW